MRNKLFYPLFLLLLFIFSCKHEKADFVIKNVSFFDGESYREGVTLIVQHGRVDFKSADAKYPDAAVMIDGKGKTIIPPILNAHVHAWEPGNLEEAIRSGVFALLDTHTTDSSAGMLREYRNHTGYAFYYASGPGATVPGGHGTQYGIDVPTINDSVSPRQFTEDRINHQADYIKILREPSRNTINFLQTKEVIDVAHEHSKLCVAHISRLDDGMQLANQKVDGFAHIWFNQSINKSQLDSLAEAKVFIIPTLLVTKKLLEFKASKKKNKNLLSFDEVLSEVKKAYENGIPILAGTDAPNFEMNFGDDIFEELKLLSRAGLSNIDVLKAATSKIYKAFKLKEFGILQDGSSASFILINGNPINNINDINTIVGIWQNGNRIK